MTRVALRVSTTGAERALDPRRIGPILREAVEQAAIHVERAWNRRARSGIFKHPTGKYASSIAHRIFPGGLQAEVAPHVVYAEWLEVGSRGRHIPESHRRSAFPGYGLRDATLQETRQTIGVVVQRVFESRLRAGAT